jgi:hypothetical protein
MNTDTTAGNAAELLAERVMKALMAKLTGASAAIPIEIDLWNVETIASYLKRSISGVRERIVCQPSFPVAIRIPTGSGQRGHALWKAAEVIAWAMSHREKETR